METGGKLDDRQWYDHVQKLVETRHEVKVTALWNKQVRTDRTVPNNKPDIIIRDNKQVTCMSIDAVIPEDGNVIKTEAEKILTLRLPD